MGGAFLGRQLIAANLISESDLLFALEVQRTNNPLLGELAIEVGYLTADQVNDINIVQRIINKKFGDIAVAESLLTAQQLDELLSIQAQRKKLLGVVLVEAGFISEVDLMPFLGASIKSDPECGQITPLDNLDSVVLGAVETVFSRVAHTHCKHEWLMTEVSSPKALENMTVGVIKIGFSREDMNYLTIALALNWPVIVEIASQFMAIEVQDCDDDLCVDAFSEFLNVIAGYVIKSPDTADDLMPSQAVVFSDMSFLEQPFKKVGFETELGGGYTLISLF